MGTASKYQGLGLNKLAKNIGMTLFRRFAGFFVGLGRTILFARLLGPQGNGIYAMVVLLPEMLASFANFGVASGNTYFLGRKDVSVRNALKSSLILWVLFSLVGIGFAVPLILKGSSQLFPNIPVDFLWYVLPVFPLVMLQAYLISIFQGVQDFRRYNLFLLLTPAFIFFIALFTLWGLKMKVEGALWAYAIGQLGGLLFTVFGLRVHLSVGSGGKKVREYIKFCLGYGWKAHLSLIFAFINYRIDIFFVNYFLTPAATGMYTVAVMIAEKLWILSYAVNSVIFPRLSHLYQDQTNKSDLTALVSRWVLLITLGGSLVIAVLAKYIILLFVGEEYIDSVQPLLWLLPGIVTWSYTRVLSFDFAARGKIELNMYLAFFGFLVNVGCNILLIPRFGMKGAALATTLTYTLDAAIKTIVFSKLSNVSWWVPLFPRREDWVLLQTGIGGWKAKAKKNPTPTT